MKFKKPIIIGSIITGVATVASTAVIATQINPQNTQSSPNIMMNTSNWIRSSNGRMTNMFVTPPSTMETENTHSLRLRMSKPHYDDQAYGARYFLRTKAPNSSTWTTVKEGFLYYIINDDDIYYNQDITWNIDRTINLENEFKVDVVFDLPKVWLPRSRYGEDSGRYVEYYTNFPTSMRTKNGSVTMGSAKNYQIWSTVNGWVYDQGGRVGSPTWEAFNTHDIDDPSSNTLIRPSAFSEILFPIFVYNDNAYNQAKLKSLKFKIIFKGRDHPNYVGTANLTIRGYSKVKVNLESFSNS